MRLATYNVEWFDRLFDDEGQLVEDGAWSARYKVTRARQAAALGLVFRALDADAVLVVEAPDSSGRRDGALALETFARRFGLRARRGLIGYANDTQQEIALLYDPDMIVADHVPEGTIDAPRFDATFRIDLDVDARTDRVTWSKPPLEVALSWRPTGTRLRLIGVHAKSKNPKGVQGADALMRRAIENRRKQLAQCIWLRARIDDHLAAGDSLVVLGDINDGPGLDEYEALFGRSGLDIVRGEAATRLHDPHALSTTTCVDGRPPRSARFWLGKPRGWLDAMLDYVMISSDLCPADPHWRIWHPLDDRDIAADSNLRAALLDASDHFPVSLDLDINALAAGPSTLGSGA